MLLRYRFRIYPTLPQRRALAQTFGCVRVVYNDAVARAAVSKVAWSRELPSTPSSVTVIKTATEKYYASFVVAVDEASERLPAADFDTGIDLGLKDFAVLRGGKVIANPRFFKRLERKLRSAQRSLSRKQPGSKNRERARLKVARVHEKVRHSRSDWIDKQVKTIVAENQGIFVEDLQDQGAQSQQVCEEHQGCRIRHLSEPAREQGS